VHPGAAAPRIAPSGGSDEGNTSVPGGDPGSDRAGGFRGDSEVIESPFPAGLDEIAAELPLTAFCLAAGDVELEAEPESGPHGKIAEALDAADEAEARVKKSEAALTQAEKEVAAFWNDQLGAFKIHAERKGRKRRT
jgi:hypothetical protein